MAKVIDPRNAAFHHRMDKARAAVSLVGDYIFHVHNLAVRLVPTRYAPSVEEAADYFDAGDIFVGLDEERCEVKGLNWHWTSPADHPFPNRMIICDAKVWKRSDPKPRCIYLVNDDFTNIICVRSKTSDDWFEAHIRSAFYPKGKLYMCANIACATFHKVSSVPRQPSLLVWRGGKRRVAKVEGQGEFWEGRVLPFRGTAG